MCSGETWNLGSPFWANVFASIRVCSIAAKFDTFIPCIWPTDDNWDCKKIARENNLKLRNELQITIYTQVQRKIDYFLQVPV